MRGLGNRFRLGLAVTGIKTVLGAIQAFGVGTTAQGSHLIPSPGAQEADSDAYWLSTELTGILDCPEEASELVRPQAISLSYGFDPKFRVSTPEEAFELFVKGYWPGAPPPFALASRTASAARFVFENRRAFVLVTQNDVRNWAVTSFNACLKEFEAWED